MPQSNTPITPNTPNAPAQVQEKPKAAAPGRNIFGFAVAGLIILIILVSVWFVIKAPSLTSSPTGESETTFGSQNAVKVENVGDLEKLEKEVRDTNIDNLSSDLDKNDSDVISF